MKKRILITGASGFVGSNITQKLVENGEQIAILVRNKKTDWRLKSIANKVDVYECDLQNEKLAKVIDKIRPTHVFHLAVNGATPTSSNEVNNLIDTNIKGTLQLLNAIRKHDIKLFINTGSSSEYGSKSSSMSESDVLEPINDYGVTKAATTLFCQKIALRENMPIITLRLFSPFGYFDEKARLISYVTLQAIKNEPIHLSSADNVRDFIFIEDVVNAYLSAMMSKVKQGEIINIGSGKQHSVYDIVQAIIKITGSTSSIYWNSVPKHDRQLEPSFWQADITKAKNVLRWAPKYTLSDGLLKTVQWFKKNRRLYE